MHYQRAPETRMEVRMKEPYGESLASYTDPESCAWYSRKAAREA